MKQNTIQTAFTAGQLSPDLYGRVDVQRYAQAAKELTNVQVRVQGGVENRPGMHFIATSAINTGDIKLIPFVFNRSQSYVLEFTDGKIRFHQNGKQVTNADGSPYEITSGMPAGLLTGLDYAQSGDTLFLAHPLMKPRRVVRTSQLSWVCEAVPFDVMPFEELNPSPPGWLHNDEYSATDITKGNNHVGQVVKMHLTNDDVATGSYTGTGFKLPTGTVGQPNYNPGDLGKYISVNRGLVRIQSIQAKDKITVEIRALMFANTPASSDDWRLKETIWNDTLGWPACVCIHEQRLVFAGSNKYPLTIWGSKLREYYRYELADLDSSAYSFTLSSDQVNPITSLFSHNALVAWTASNEYLITSTGGAITPSDVDVRVPSAFGAAEVRPVRCGTELVYIQRARRKVMAMAYDPDSQLGYGVSNLSLLASSMSDVGVADMAYQQEPNSLIHAVLANGEMLTITYDKEAQVVAWTRQITDGIIKAICCIPTDAGVDVAYLAVQRFIGSVAHTYIEAFDDTAYSDSCLFGEVLPGGDPQSVWDKLGHIEGHTVDILADGIPQPRQVVTGGKVTLTRTAYKTQIGLPFTCRVVMLKPEVQTPTGTAQATRNSIDKVILRVLNTTGCSVNGDPIPWRTFGISVLDKPAPLYTGDVNWQGNGWNNEELVIEQPQSLPFYLLAVIRSITTN